MKKITPANSAGKFAEGIAATYLLEQGLNLIAQNFHCRFGEIDLIAIEQDTLVFIEVRYRKKERFISAIETIDTHKCRRIITTSEYYLNKHKIYRRHQCRFDVIAITGEINKPAIEWIKNAFQA